MSDEPVPPPGAKPPDASGEAPSEPVGERPPPPEQAKPAPGWYPDPERPGQRYWDGDEWTEHWTPPPPDAGYAPVQTKSNGFAIASMVLGILWIYWLGSILALVFGYVAKNQIDRSGGRQSGRGMAIAGIVLGWIGIAILVLVIVFVATGVSSEPY
jgi:Domain of unknown function (DUF4190)/Protein of unknown function (DUF2510)